RARSWPGSSTSWKSACGVVLRRSGPMSPNSDRGSTCADRDAARTFVPASSPRRRVWRPRSALGCSGINRMGSMRIHIATDHAGLDFSTQLQEHLRGAGHEAVDHGPVEYDALDDYPAFCIRAEQ